MSVYGYAHVHAGAHGGQRHQILLLVVSRPTQSLGTELCLCLPSTGTKGEHHHSWPNMTVFFFLNKTYEVYEEYNFHQ